MISVGFWARGFIVEPNMGRDFFFLIFALHAFFYKLLHCEAIDTSTVKDLVVHFLGIWGFFEHAELYRLCFSSILLSVSAP